jgi:hypothetical protein
MDGGKEVGIEMINFVTEEVNDVLRFNYMRAFHSLTNHSRSGLSLPPSNMTISTGDVARDRGV